MELCFLPSIRPISIWSMDVCEKEMPVCVLLRKVSCFQRGYFKVFTRNCDNPQSRS